MTDIFAAIVYDSWVEAIPDLRSVPHPDRHLIFEGNGLILDLLLKKQSRGTCIHVGGQILPRDGELSALSGVHVLIEQGGQRATTNTNELGEFAFHTVPNGTLDLTITLNGYRFLVRGLSNQQPRTWRVEAVSA
jgi:hypothetical protein